MQQNKITRNKYKQLKNISTCKFLETTLFLSPKGSSSGFCPGPPLLCPLSLKQHNLNLTSLPTFITTGQAAYRHLQCFTHRHQISNYGSFLDCQTFFFFQHIMLYYFKKGKNTTEMQKKICAVYRVGAVSDRTCQKWFAKFVCVVFFFNCCSITVVD